MWGFLQPAKYIDSSYILRAGSLTVPGTLHYSAPHGVSVNSQSVSSNSQKVWDLIT